MKIKDTVSMKMDDLGRTIEREHSIEIDDYEIDCGCDEIEAGGECVHRASMKHILAAIQDYRDSRQWN